MKQKKSVESIVSNGNVRFGIDFRGRRRRPCRRRRHIGGAVDAVDGVFLLILSVDVFFGEEDVEQFRFAVGAKRRADVVQHGGAVWFKDIRLGLPALDRLQMLLPEGVVVQRAHEHQTNLLPQLIIGDSQVGGQIPGQRNHGDFRFDG